LYLWLGQRNAARQPYRLEAKVLVAWANDPVLPVAIGYRGGTRADPAREERDHGQTKTD
jgi:hypothetical protein